jgi:phosphinothricin acetyltransferase
MSDDRLEGVTVRPMTEDDWPAVRAIFEAGIASGDATFEITPPTWEQFDTGHRPDLRLVATVDGKVAGWVAAVPYSARAVYRGVAEESIYVDPSLQGRGVGRALLETMIAASERAGVWTLQAGILPENGASVTLHRALGFREVGTRERIGWHRGRWRDVIVFERRSALADRPDGGEALAP